MSKPSLGLEARRRRQATACTTCRDRRVRCDRSRPACTRCLRGGRSCQYTNVLAPTIEFVQPRGLGTSTSSSPRSETWRSIIEQQHEEAQNTQLEETKALESRSDYPFISISFFGDAFVSSVRTKLPSYDDCQPLLESFLVTIHPVIPVCHIPTLRKTYSEFWSELSPSTSAELLLLVSAILYTGMANTSREMNAQSLALDELYEELARALDLSSYYATPSPSSIMLLQGFLIMNTFRAGHIAPFIAFGFLPLAIRFAQSLRLHVRQHTGSDVEQDVRGRLWWHLVSLDLESTIASGLSTIISSGSYTARMPSIPWIGVVEGSEGKKLSPIMIAIQGYWELAHHMQLWYERKPEPLEIVDFRRSIENLVKIIDKDDCESEWARVYLKILIDRAYCMLGLRSWQLDLFKGMDFHSEVMKTSRSFLERYIKLAELSQLMGCNWFIPGLIQPIHALMILLVHLDGYTCPDEEAIITRDLIDQVFTLRQDRILTSINFTTARFNNLRQQNPRYSALITLKTRVWQKLNWPIPYTSNLDVDLRSVKSLDGASLQGNSDINFGHEYPVEENSISAFWDEFTAGASLDAGINNWEGLDLLSSGYSWNSRYAS